MKVVRLSALYSWCSFLLEAESVQALFLSFSTGPGAYTPDAPQPGGLLCYPFLDIPTFATSPSSSSVQPKRSLVAKGGTAWARIVAGNFA